MQAKLNAMEQARLTGRWSLVSWKNGSAPRHGAIEPDNWVVLFVTLLS